MLHATPISSDHQAPLGALCKPCRCPLCTSLQFPATCTCSLFRSCAVVCAPSSTPSCLAALLTSLHDTLAAGHSPDSPEYGCDLSPILNCHVTRDSSVGIVTSLRDVAKELGVRVTTGSGPFSIVQISQVGCGIYRPISLCVARVKRPGRETDTSS
jgi:hypothetical protein